MSSILRQFGNLRKTGLFRHVFQQSARNPESASGIHTSPLCYGHTESSKPPQKLEDIPLTNQTISQNKKSWYKKYEREISTGEISAGASVEQTDPDDEFGTLSPDSKLFQRGAEKISHAAKPHKKQRKKKLAKVKHIEEWGDSDTFGTMTDPKMGADFEIQKGSLSVEDDVGEDDQFDKPYQRLSATNRKHKPIWYAKKIQELFKQHMVYEAIQMFEETMIKEDRVMPNVVVFTILINGLAKVGYTDKAFRIYNKMKKMHIHPHDKTYTCLFNACANSPSAEDGLERSSKLFAQLHQQNYRIHAITYAAAIKAFARHGDLGVAFSLLDRALAGGIRLHPKMISMIMQGCVSDKEAGFKHAVEVWRSMREKKIRPVIYHYNLLLRAARECGAGGEEFARQLINNRLEEGGVVSQEQLPPPQMNTTRRTENTLRGDAREGQRRDDQITKSRHKQWWEYEEGDKLTVAAVKEIDSSTTGPTVVDTTLAAAPAPVASTIPNVLDPQETYQGVLSIGSLETRQERLALLGGADGVIAQMAKDRVQPTIQTFTMLVDLIARDSGADIELLFSMLKHNVSPDTGFFNQIIRKRCLNDYDLDGARGVLPLMADYGVEPDIRTYGCLAMGCKSKTDGVKLLNDMEKADIVPSSTIIEILMHRSKDNFGYKSYLCDTMKRQRIAPTEYILGNLDFTIQKNFAILAKEQRGEEVPEHYTKVAHKSSFKTFMRYYKPWLKSMPFEKTPKPWDAYKHPTIAVDKEVDRKRRPRDYVTVSADGM